MSDLRDKIVGVLDIEGAFCGICDREPGDSTYCKACVRVLNGYAEAVLAVLDLDTVRAEAQVEVLEDLAIAYYFDGRQSIYDTIMRRADRIAREAGIETGESND